MPKYSIITPVYNSFHLMERYFESLENQTYKNFEVILVDDCSTDNSYEKLQGYAEKGKIPVHVYRTEKNQGPGNARNLGMDNASGEWITFIDNDDWVDTRLLEKVENVLKVNDVYCVIYDYFIQRGKKITVARSMYRGTTGHVSLPECMISVRNHTFGKFYKFFDCIEKPKFPTLRRCEDVAFVARAIDACGSVYYLNEPLYYYVQRKDSLSNNRTIDEQDLIKAFSILEETLGMKYPKEIKEKSVPDLLYGVVLLMCKAGKTDREIKEYIERYSDKYPDWDESGIIKDLGMSKKKFLKAIKHEAICILRLFAEAHTKLTTGGKMSV